MLSSRYVLRHTWKVFCLLMTMRGRRLPSPPLGTLILRLPMPITTHELCPSLLGLASPDSASPASAEAASPSLALAASSCGVQKTKSLPRTWNTLSSSSSPVHVSTSSSWQVFSTGTSFSASSPPASSPSSPSSPSLLLALKASAWDGAFENENAEVEPKLPNDVLVPVAEDPKPAVPKPLKPEKVPKLEVDPKLKPEEVPKPLDPNEKAGFLSDSASLGFAGDSFSFVDPSAEDSFSFDFSVPSLSFTDDESAFSSLEALLSAPPAL
mmetsp:Transcript_83485/g.223505  ORF Transcript_83485/g.223505 Transcript_83485/m.223505 type:complete len:268 (+) Transcript_83485:178-981(+)